MKHYRYLLPIGLLPILLLLIVGTASTFAQKQQDSQEILRQAVLHETDFPENTEKYAFSSGKSKVEDFNEQVSFVTSPFWAEGFVDAYRVNGWYPLAFEDDTFKEFSSGAFVENIAYLFKSQEQAAKAFEQQITRFNFDAKDIDAKVESVQYNNLQGKLMQINYTQEGMDFTLYTFVGWVDNQLIFLMVDGIPDPTVQRTFEHLVTTLVSYQ